MPNKRRSDKRMVGFYASEDEALAMMEAAKAQGMTLADWFRSLIPVKQTPTKPKTVAKRRGTSKETRRGLPLNP
jgi:hypothetical protein